ncbi:hypothetical protein [Kitasatospora sp. NPDC005751]|uniref:hypothetical protein n=1 Tax=Kitasatospora sp. NPDC005751 TaxID=3157064 RepID=UPI0033F733C2
MPQFDHHTLAVIDDTHDREQASDGRSRYGAYLTRHAHRLNDDGRPLTPAAFAVAAWRIATAPIMAPGYVRVRPDLHALTVETAEDDPAGIVLRITAPLRHRALAHLPEPGHWQDWEADRWADGPWPTLAEPIPGRRPVLAVTATILLPVPAVLLPTPASTRPGPGLLRDAQHTVTVLADYANRHGAPEVADLIGGDR